MSVDVAEAEQLRLKPCKHQVAGHLFEDGKAGSLVDESGHFYKPLQIGARGERELAFYQYIAGELKDELRRRKSSQEPGCYNEDPPRAQRETTGPKDEAWKAQKEMLSSWQQRRLAGGKEQASSSGRGPQEDMEAYSRSRFSVRNATLLTSIPRFYGLLDLGERQLLELEDVTRHYRHPSIVDIKVGLRTWYAGADPRHIERWKRKDNATTQAVLGFKVCGMQVYRHFQGGYWRASKRWCKQMPLEEVPRALIRFADNEVLVPEDIYGGPNGVIANLQQLESWFQKQREFQFYSSSVLLIYEGDAESAEEANVSVRLVDFAHTFPAQGQPDANFIAGLGAMIQALNLIMQDPDAMTSADKTRALQTS